MTDNKKLIEQARYEYKNPAPGSVGDLIRRLAEALEAAEKALTPTDDEREALARIIKDITIKWSGPSLAEFANTPPIRKHYATADAILAAGFRHTEVPEPSDDPTCICPNTLGWHTTECVASRPEPETAEAQAYSKGFTEGSDQAHRDKQGEPSSEVPEPSAEGYAEFEDWEQEMFRHQPVLSMHDGSIAGCQCLNRVFVKGREDWGTHLATIITSRLTAEPQGEPSDALPLWERPEAIEAARLAYQGAYEADYDAEDCIAFALRAAGVVAQEGEPR